MSASAVRVVEREFGELALNMGPQHPSTHGVLRIVLHLSGETVVRAVPSIGYLHRGVEKLAEHLAYDQLAPVFERDDYLAPTANSHAFVLAAEALGKIEAPRRGRWIRALVAEWQRIASHLVWLGTLGLDLGGALGGGTTLYMYCFREREKILDLMESLTGTRFHTNVNMIGGARYDLDAETAARSSALAAEIEAALPSLAALSGGTPIFRERTRGVGVIPKDLAMGIGVTGPTLRGSGIRFDVRRAAPYDAYDELPFEIPIRAAGDAEARFQVRMDEIVQSLGIVRRIVEGLPAGPIFSRKPLKNPKATKLPAGEAYVAVESPRGELGFHIVSDGGAKPYRLKISAPSFRNLQVVPHLLPGGLVADVVAILGSLDPVMGDVDR
ncbi:MAG TPA: NADH-quinone oxidoreductase subunit D [Candidatus Polarisedimenticolaceae bacterium]|nr:NADH-quinone oxidoreductase subunit D [Candidatus Polarisedimenticolaceae bacterium]